MRALVVSLLLLAAQTVDAVRKPVMLPGITGAVEAAMGQHFFLVRLADGSVVSWGLNSRGQLGTGRKVGLDGPNAGKRINDVAQGVPAPVTGLADVVSIAAGAEHALAVTRDGHVWGWGSNGSSQLTGKPSEGRTTPAIVPGIADAVAVAAQGDASYALLRDGRVLGWGDRLWMNDANRQVALQAPTPVPGIAHATAIRAGLPSLALLADGSVMSWGMGYLGDGHARQQPYSTDRVSQPAKVEGIDDATSIAAGTDRSAVIRRDGSVWIWGRGDSGGLGNGTNGSNGSADQRVPVMLKGAARAVDISLASASSIVFADGTIKSWGDERLGATGRTGIERLMTPTAIPGVTDLARVWSSLYANVGLTKSGRVLVWGNVLIAPGS